MRTFSHKQTRELLQTIAAGLNRHHDVKGACLEVALFDADGTEVLVTDVPTVLDYLANDLTWNEESDWSDAVYAEVRTL